MGNKAKFRWALKNVNVNTSTFCVEDKQTGKCRYFHVPYLEDVELIESFAYIFTSSAKVMQLNLDNNARQFLTAFQLLGLKLNNRPAHVMHNKNSLVLEARLT